MPSLSRMPINQLRVPFLSVPQARCTFDFDIPYVIIETYKGSFSFISMYSHLIQSIVLHSRIRYIVSWTLNTIS